MAIQISEKHLSPEARKALSNAKNKSQFMRDAIEFYVKREFSNNDIEISCDTQIKKELKEIKEMLIKLSSNKELYNSLQETASDLNKNNEESIEQEEKITKRNDLDVEIPDCYL